MENLFDCGPNVDEIASTKKSDNEATAEIPHTDQTFFAEDPMFTPCPEWEEKLAATHPDDLELDERIALEKHLKTCPSCAAVRQLDRIVDIVIRDLAEPDASLTEPSLELPPRLRALCELSDYLENSTDQAKESWGEADTPVDRPLEENSVDRVPIVDRHFAQTKREAMTGILATLKRWISYTCERLVRWYKH